MADLEQVAYEYIQAGKYDKPSLKNTLVQSGVRSVVPLLRGGIRATRKLGELYVPKFRTTPLESMAGMLLISGFKISAAPITADVVSVVEDIGQAGMDEVAVSPTNSDTRLATFAILCLLAKRGQTWQTIRKVHEAYQFYESNPHKRAEYYRMLELLVILYSQEGEKMAEQIIANAAHKGGMSADQWKDELQLSAWMSLMM